jgi:predicted MFS family arabinose efflux permease
MSDLSESSEAPHPRQPIWQLGVLFATIYAVQGINEPGEGLLSIPTRTLLDQSLHLGESQITDFMAWIAFPWAIKPLYGLLSDFVPIFGSHRRNYLLLLAVVSGISFATIALWPEARESSRLLFYLLLIPGVATAFCDVVTDGLMVQTCQPIGMTGKMQSVQWTAIYAASIWASWYGGRLAQAQNFTGAVWVCSAVTVALLLITYFTAKEPAREYPQGAFVHTLRALMRSFVSPVVLPAAIFLFLWHFNPFSSTVYQFFQKHTLEFDEKITGNLQAINYTAMMVAVFSFGQYCQRISFRATVHGAIAFGVLSNLFYVVVSDYPTAVMAAILEGLSTGTAQLMLLDVAARMVPPEVAGTVFALLMSCANLGKSLGIKVGGKLDEHFKESVSPAQSFHRLVMVAALFTAATWLVVPWILRHEPRRIIPKSDRD